MIAILGVIVGALIGLAVNFSIPPEYLKFFAVAILASFDSICGGFASQLQQNFKLKIFISGFFGNAIIAIILTYIGELLNVDLNFVAVLVFGTRIFQNFAIIRRILLNKLTNQDKML